MSVPTEAALRALVAFLNSLPPGPAAELRAKLVRANIDLTHVPGYKP